MSSLIFVRDTANSPFCASQTKRRNSDWLADQWDEPSVLGHAQIHKGRMNGADPDIDTVQTPKRLDGCSALPEKIRKTFTDSTGFRRSLEETKIIMT